MQLTTEEQAIARGALGDAAAIAMHIVVDMTELLGGTQLVEISSAHIDGCLYHGDGGVEFAERLVSGGAKARVPTTLNVGALDLLHPTRVRGDQHRYDMARRQMVAYEKMGCRPTWTCAPYQAGHRPRVGDQVAWGESNAVAFVNSVLGARTNRYGDFLDICCAVTGRAPLTGLHLPENRYATTVIDTHQLSPTLKNADVFYPVFGSWLGSEIGDEIPVIDGLSANTSEDRLKALGAAAAATGAVGLFHVAGVTPEAPDLETVLGGREPARVIEVTAQMIRAQRDRMSTTDEGRLDAVAVGSPHFSLSEFAQLERWAEHIHFRIPFYVCTGRGVLKQLEDQGRAAALRGAGVEIVVDTCVVVTPILPAGGGVLMTNSGKFAHYTPANTGYEVVYGSLEDCIASAEAGHVVRDDALWS
jgi:predicted aconitase